MENKKVIIVGCGFAGLNAAKALKNTNLDITIIDKENHHLFQPLLYQVAAAALSPGDIATPIRAIFNDSENIRVVMGEVTSVDKENRKVFAGDFSYQYDYLIIAAGASHSYFGNDQWIKFAPGLKTLDDALTIRERTLLSFEKAEKEESDEEIKKLQTFVIVGGGPTGVEMAGAIAEISNKAMIRDFRKIDPAKTRVILAEGMDRVLAAYDKELTDAAKNSLESLGVEVRLNEFVKEINDQGVKIGDEFVETYNVIWAAGNKASGLCATLNTDTDKMGRVTVENDCSIPGFPEVFVLGDAANFIQDGKPLPGLAPVAVQQGKYAAKLIKKGIPKKERKPFSYFDKGTMATIGRAKAIAQIGKIKLSGFIAWLMWSFIHVMYLIGFRNKYKVMAEWIWFYIANRHGVRLITGKLKY